MTEKKIYCQVWNLNGYWDLTFDQWSMYIQGNYKTLHKKDGPALIYEDGSEEWRQHGKLHRTDGPAITKSDGTRAWYQNDKFHRIDGPALILYNKHFSWYLHDKMLPKESVEVWIEENQIDLSTPEGQTAFLLKWA